MIIQSEPEKFFKNRISAKKFYIVSDFESKNIQYVSFWILIFDNASYVKCTTFVKYQVFIL